MTSHFATADIASSSALAMAGSPLALDASDTTVLRCIEAGVAVPAEWLAYRGALRAIVTDPTSADALPPRPEYPAGT